MSVSGCACGDEQLGNLKGQCRKKKKEKRKNSVNKNHVIDENHPKALKNANVKNYSP